jgi:hypothetical protein
MRWLLRLALPLLVGACSAGCGAGRGAVAPSVTLAPTAKLLPARARRLTNLELERTFSALIGREVKLAADLPPDVRQEGYTPNAQQDVSTAWATRYAQLSRELVEQAAPRLAQLSTCKDAAQASCRRELAQKLGLLIFRRSLAAEELSASEALLAEASAQGDSFESAVALLVRALTEAPSFLYVTELGAGASAGAGSRIELDDYELASQLSYVLRGGPPDGELLAAAASGALRAAEGRVAQARRLLGMPDTRQQFRRFALEWLEVDGLLQTAKSSKLFPTYDALKPFMLAETQSYVDEVMVNGGASVHSLLAGGFASVGPEMARFYGLKTYGARASLAGSGRLGVLQQASFLAAHAHEDVTSPVKRGDFVMRKLLCEKLKRPAEIGLEVVMPAPSETLTNRQRLSQHVADPGCASCHGTLDAIGFTFETFDAMGNVQTRDHGMPVSASAHVQLGQAAPAIPFESSVALTRALLGTPVISECFARHAFRYFSAQADPEIEAAFLSLREQLPEQQRDSLVSVLLAYIASDLFVLREVRPG